MNEVTALVSAEIDMQAAYERQGTPRRASAFNVLVRSAFEQLSRHPLSAPAFIGKYHRLVLARIGYAFFYTVEGRRVVIHALLDLHQSPENIRRRLGL